MVSNQVQIYVTMAPLTFAIKIALSQCKLVNDHHQSKMLSKNFTFLSFQYLHKIMTKIYTNFDLKFLFSQLKSRPQSLTAN